MTALSLFDYTSPFESSLSFGLGEEARRVEKIFGEMQRHSLASMSLGRAKQDGLDNLYATFAESCQDGWDGYDASAASYESYQRAKRFIEALPTSFPIPEVALDPDGEVSLEWYGQPGRVFSVSIGANDELAYAGRFSPTRKTHGTELFTDQIPKVILDNIRRLLA